MLVTAGTAGALGWLVSPILALLVVVGWIAARMWAAVIRRARTPDAMLPDRTSDARRRALGRGWWLTGATVAGVHLLALAVVVHGPFASTRFLLLLTLIFAQAATIVAWGVAGAAARIRASELVPWIAGTFALGGIHVYTMRLLGADGA